MASTTKNESYFAPPTDSVPDLHSTGTADPLAWGDDAEEIARSAGLGSYGAESMEQQIREDALIRGLERMDSEMRALRVTVCALAVGVSLLFVAIVLLAMR